MFSLDLKKKKNYFLSNSLGNAFKNMDPTLTSILIPLAGTRLNMGFICCNSYFAKSKGVEILIFLFDK